MPFALIVKGGRAKTQLTESTWILQRRLAAENEIATAVWYAGRYPAKINRIHVYRVCPHISFGVDCHFLSFFTRHVFRFPIRLSPSRDNTTVAVIRNPGISNCFVESNRPVQPIRRVVSHTDSGLAHFRYTVRGRVVKPLGGGLWVPTEPPTLGVVWYSLSSVLHIYHANWIICDYVLLWFVNTEMQYCTCWITVDSYIFKSENTENGFIASI